MPKPKTAEEARERKMKQMSRALGVDIASVARILAEQEAKAQGVELTEDAEVENPPAAVEETPKAPQNLFDKFAQDPVVRQGGSKAAAKQTESSAGETVESTPGQVLVCGGTDWDNIGRSKNPTQGDLMLPHRLNFPTRIRAVFSGPTACHSVCVDEAGLAYVWGRNDFGQLGLGDQTTRQSPTALTALKGKRVASASCGRAHTAFLTEDGEVWMTGCCKSGQLGIGRVADAIPSPKLLSLAGNRAARVACGGDFTLVVDEAGRLWAYGSPEYGQLGNGSTGQYFVNASKLAFDNKLSPVLIDRFVQKDIRTKHVEELGEVCIGEIACGRNHSVAVERGGARRVFSWGFAGYGRLGHNEQEDNYTPRLVEALARQPHVVVEKVTCGAVCSMALSTLGHLYYFGMLPNAPRKEATMYPKIVDDLANWKVRVMAGGAQAVVVAAENSVIAWGQSVAGELGFGGGDPSRVAFSRDGPSKSSGKPRKVDALEGLTIQDVAMGFGHTLMIANDTAAEDSKAIEALEVFEPSEVPPSAAGASAGTKRGGESTGAGKKKGAAAKKAKKA